MEQLPTESPISTLPPELIKKIGHQLDLPSIGCIRQTCKKINAIPTATLMCDYMSNPDKCPSKSCQIFAAQPDKWFDACTQLLCDSASEKNELAFVHTYCHDAYDRDSQINYLTGNHKLQSDHNLPLIMSIYSGSIPMDQNEKERCYSFLYKAIEKSPLLAKKLLEKNTFDFLTYNPKTILTTACNYKYCSLVQLLLKQPGIDVNAKNDCGETPLHIACKKNLPEIVTLLLDNGADINSQAEYEKTALHIACTQKSPKIITLLLENNADINSQDYFKQTPLHLACEHIHGNNTPSYTAGEQNSLEIVQLLLKQPDIDVNAKTCWGNTPLHIAYTGELPKIVQELLKRGYQCNNAQQTE